MVTQQSKIILTRLNAERKYGRKIDLNDWIQLLAQRLGIVYEIQVLQETCKLLDLKDETEFEMHQDLMSKIELLNRKIISINRKLNKF